MKETAFWLFEKLADILPGFFLRLLFHPAKISRDVEIDLEGESPIVLSSLNQSVPFLDISFKITNHSRLDLELERLIIEAWFGPPTLIAIQLRRISIPAHKTISIPPLRVFVNAEQKAQIELYRANPSSYGNSYTLYTNAYIQSKVGPILVEKPINRHAI